MKNSLDFNNLFTLDLANNHLGSVEHGTNVINELGAIVNELDVKAAIKFQFRDTLDTFVHPDFKEREDVKHIPWFQQTYMDKKGYVTINEILEESEYEYGNANDYLFDYRYNDLTKTDVSAAFGAPDQNYPIHLIRKRRLIFHWQVINMSS